MSRILTSVVAALALGFGAASAQDYPSGTITIVVPFSAGGPTDTVTRLARRVAQAEPDGYTLLLHHIGMATSATLYRELPYDPKTAFAPVGLVTEVPMTLVGRPDFPPNTLAELISYAKENGEQVLYAHAGIGAASQLCGMLLMQALETQFTTVPYKGTAPALTDLMGGQVDFMCDQTTNTTNPIKAGSIKAYATLTEERLDALPDVPTAAEAGLQGIEIAIWHGLYAPAGTPDDVIAKLSETLAAALADENVVQRFAELGTAPVPPEAAIPQALQEKLLSEIDRWKPVIEAAGVYAEE
jgi:tripartite-type tricarboxylate transporter receptor subunit TctC